MSRIASPAPRRFAMPSGAVLGVVFMMGFCVAGPGIDITAKLAAQTVPVGMVVLGRFATQSALLGAAMLLFRAEMPKARDLPWHFLRGALIAGATLCFFSALRHMSVPDAMAIFFVEPMILTLLGGWILRERVGWRRYAGCAVGFAGALLIIQPSFEEVGVPALYPLGTALFFALYMMLSRRMSQEGGVLAMQFLAGLSGAAVISVALWFGEGSGSVHFDPEWPQGAEWALLAGVGIFATLAHMMVVAPVQYLEIVFAAIYSWFVFREFPDALTWAGIAVVAGSGLYVLHRERRAQIREAREAASG
jgi:S-adenosylmethionine uptake transporter